MLISEVCYKCPVCSSPHAWDADPQGKHRTLWGCVQVETESQVEKTTKVRGEGTGDEGRDGGGGLEKEMDCHYCSGESSLGK